MRWFRPSMLAANDHANHIHIHIGNYPKGPINMTTKKKTRAEMLELRAEEFEATAAELRRQAEEARRLARRSAEPDLPPSAVLVWSKQYSPAGKAFTYSAVKGHDGHYHTTAGVALTWIGLAEAYPDTLVTIYRQPLRSEVVADDWVFRSVHVMTARW